MTEEVPEEFVSNGAVDPQIVRGDLPAWGRGGNYREQKAIYTRHRELARAFPPVLVGDELQGGWVLCAVQKTRGHGPKERLRRIMADRRRLTTWLDRKFPLERYQAAIRTDADAVRTLYFRWVGDLTPEQDQEDRRQRRIRWEHMEERRAEVAAQRALKNRGQRGGQG